VQFDVMFVPLAGKAHERLCELPAFDVPFHAESLCPQNENETGEGRGIWAGRRQQFIDNSEA
jgi:hypothetical protein